MIARNRFRGVLVLGTWAASLATAAAAGEPVRVPAAELLSHFPDRAHAVVWRNWHAVEPERIAKVLGCSVENVQSMAQSMGLPPPVAIPPEQKSRGYFFMTMCRRNWHLLPIGQLAALLDTTPAQLMNFLQVEEMANWVILGGFKPECPPVRYEVPNDQVRGRAAHIRQIVEEYFGDELRQPGEPRFAFVQRLSQPRPDFVLPPSPGPHLFAPRFLCSYLKIYGDPLSDPQVDMYPEGLLQRLAEVGVDGVWLYGVLRELAPGGPPFPEFLLPSEPTCPVCENVSPARPFPGFAANHRFLRTPTDPLPPFPRPQRSRHTIGMLRPRESATSDRMPSQARSLKRLRPFADATSAAASANSTRLRWADSHVR